MAETKQTYNALTLLRALAGVMIVFIMPTRIAFRHFLKWAGRLVGECGGFVMWVGRL